VITQRFRERFDAKPQVIASAPGRVNLIGEHTDYNDGFVLPMAIDRRLDVAIARRRDHRVTVWSEEFAEGAELDEDQSDRGNPWSAYVAGVFYGARTLLGLLPGMNVLIGRGIPVGAGLASSASLEMAVARAIWAVAGAAWDPVAAARLGQRVESNHLGVRSGIMDQIAVTFGKAGHSLLIDCRSLAVAPAPMPRDVAIVVMDTGMRRALTSSAYNERRTACETVVAVMQRDDPAIRALRDVTEEMLLEREGRLGATEFRRALHVVRENRRPAAMTAAFAARDYATAGQLINDSHASLRDLYEVSSQHLDIICDAARAHPACFGARMTGAGFGGCAVALVRADAAADFIRTTQPQYEARTYQRSTFYVVAADEGVTLRQ